MSFERLKDFTFNGEGVQIFWRPRRTPMATVSYSSAARMSSAGERSLAPSDIR